MPNPLLSKCMICLHVCYYDIHVHVVLCCLMATCTLCQLLRATACPATASSSMGSTGMRERRSTSSCALDSMLDNNFSSASRTILQVLSSFPSR